MRILVTGATGFIGQYVVNYLLSLGKYNVITTAARNKEEAENVFPILKQTDYISKDLNQKEEDYYVFFKKPDCVIHLSWEGLPHYNELFHVEKNLPANFYFIKNMIQNGLTDITIAGTCFEYGLQNGCLGEETAASPVTAYGLAKDSLRRFIEILHNTYKFNLKWVRLFYPYGHGQAKKTLWGQLEEAVENKPAYFNMSPGEQLRDFIPVACAAERISRIALQNKITGIINCCSGKPVSVRKFAEDFFKERGIDMKIKLGYYPYQNFEPLAFWGDTMKFSKIPPPPRNFVDYSLPPVSRKARAAA